MKKVRDRVVSVYLSCRKGMRKMLVHVCLELQRGQVGKIKKEKKVIVIINIGGFLKGRNKSSDDKIPGIMLYK